MPPWFWARGPSGLQQHRSGTLQSCKNPAIPLLAMEGMEQSTVDGRPLRLNGTVMGWLKAVAHELASQRKGVEGSGGVGSISSLVCQVCDKICTRPLPCSEAPPRGPRAAPAAKRHLHHVPSRILMARVSMLPVCIPAPSSAHC
jgi:hypothetical protein